MVKRANELAVAGLLAPSYIQEVLLPVILETQETLNRIKKDLDSLHRKLSESELQTTRFQSFQILL